MGSSGITVLPYIDPSSYETATASKSTNTNTSTNTSSTDKSFDETLSAAQKAAAALAIDTLVLASSTGTVDSATVQNYFNEHNINITVSSPTSATNNAVTSDSADTSSTNTNATADTSNKSAVDDTVSISDSDVLNCSDELEQYFNEAAEAYGVEVKFLKAIAKQESNFDPSATSSSGAMGVMQLMPFTADELGVENPYDARENIMGGAKLIAQLLEQYGGDKSLALAAYNAGSGNVKKYGGIPPFEETQNYVKKVLGYYYS